MIVLLIVGDTLKADAPGFAGGRAATPFMDNLARAGTWFQEMFASAAWTVPSVMSMLTGALGHQVGLCRWRHPFPARCPTLLTAFAAAGFEVACFHPYPKWGLLTVPGRDFVAGSQNPEAVVRNLREGGDHDRFIFLLHWWTHLPYLNRELSRPDWHAACDFSLESLHRHPARIAPRLEESYLKSVSYFSEDVLPRYLDAAATGGRDVVVAVTGDHGETWGRSLPPGRRVEQVYDLHGRWISDETIKVPLLLHGKGIPAGQALPGFAGGVDVAPTLAELAGIDWPGPPPQGDGPGIIDRGDVLPEIIGRSLAPCIAAGTPAPRREVITISSHNTHEPRTYPATGSDMWRTMALRTTDAWYVWDGVARERTIAPTSGKVEPDEATSDEIFTRLEALRLQAVDSGPTVDDDQVDALRGADEQVGRKLRSLGYLD